MLLENMNMVFSAIRASKMRSFLTILSIIIGIGSVISIVSVGNTMGNLFADLYKDVDITQAYTSIGYWVDDTRQTDYFTLDEVEWVHEVFEDKVAYIDCSSYTSAEAINRKTKISFDYQSIGYNYTDMQPVDVICDRYLNEGSILGRKKNVVVDVDSTMKLFGTENAIGMTFRATIYGSTDGYMVVGVYKKEINAFQKLMMGGSSDKGSAFIPYTILTWPDDYFYQLHVYAEGNVNLDDFFNQLRAYVADLHGRQPEDMYLYTTIQEMTSVDTMMGGLSMAVGSIAAIPLLVGGVSITDIMLVSVAGRTREVDIRKALGTRTRDVLIQFLTESATLSACGGIIGIVIGVGLVSLGGMALGLPVVVKPNVVVLAITFSAIVDIFFDLYPASKTARANPTGAPRYKQNKRYGSIGKTRVKLICQDTRGR